MADTAFSIAAVRADESKLPLDERLFDDPYAALFRAAGAHAEEGTQRFLDLPFFRDGIRLRTRFIDDVVRDRVGAGIDQLVLYGAGFDARALRMREISERRVHVYEVDLPEQLERKRAVLAAGGVEVPATIAYVPCDLSGDFELGLAHALATHGFQRERGALFVWEGVTTYIGVAAVDRSLAFIASHAGPAGSVVFDFGARFFAAESVDAHVTRAGFASCRSHGCDELWRRYLPGEPHPAAWVARLAVADMIGR